MSVNDRDLLYEFLAAHTDRKNLVTPMSVSAFIYTVWCLSLPRSSMLESMSLAVAHVALGSYNETPESGARSVLHCLYNLFGSFPGPVFSRHETLCAMFRGAMNISGPDGSKLPPEEALTPLCSMIDCERPEERTVFFDGLYCLSRHGLDYRDLCSDHSDDEKGYVWSDHASNTAEVERRVCASKEGLNQVLRIPALVGLTMEYVLRDSVSCT